MKKIAQWLYKVNPFPSTQVASAASDILEAYNDLQRFKSEQQTERHQISKDTEFKIEAIKAQKEVLLEALKNDLKTKTISIEKTFSILDKAIEQKNIGVIEQSLGAIISITKESSITSLKSLHKQLQDKNNVIDI